MAIKLSEKTAEVLAPFQKVIGEKAWPKIVADVSAELGRVHITTSDGEWKAASKLKITARDNHAIQLAPNNPASHLIHFAIRLNEISRAGCGEKSKMTIDASLPDACIAWIAAEQAKALLAPAPAAPAPAPARA